MCQRDWPPIWVRAIEAAHPFTTVWGHQLYKLSYILNAHKGKNMETLLFRECWHYPWWVQRGTLLYPEIILQPDIPFYLRYNIPFLIATTHSHLCVCETKKYLKDKHCPLQFKWINLKFCTTKYAQPIFLIS